MSRKFSGNALMEYALPAAIILVTAGVFATAFDIQNMIPKFFVASSGHNTGAIQDKIFKPSELAEGARGSATGDGSEGNFANFGTMVDGAGTSVGFNLPPDRGGTTQTAGSHGNDQEFPYTFPPPRRGGGGPDVPPGSSDELAARIRAGSQTSAAISLYQQAGNNEMASYLAAQLSAQQSGTAAYAGRNPDEVAQVDPDDVSAALTSMGDVAASADTQTGTFSIFGVTIDLNAVLTQANGEANAEQSQLQSACAVDSETCGEAGSNISVLQQLMAIFGGSPNDIGLTEGATPRVESETDSWYDEQSDPIVDRMTAEYEAAAGEDG